jgi:EAL domain-containing protein (putative c-di-GMP-specific phosphodiesterase class I)
VRALSEAVRPRGFRFALESFGTLENSLRLLELVPVDFVKLHGSLMQAVASDPHTLEHVRMLIDAASQRFIQTIGESVPDRDTMSVLWQAGMQYAQASFAEQPRERVRR